MEVGMGRTAQRDCFYKTLFPDGNKFMVGAYSSQQVALAQFLKTSGNLAAVPWLWASG
jgi:hypothetical protein